MMCSVNFRSAALAYFFALCSGETRLFCVVEGTKLKSASSAADEAAIILDDDGEFHSQLRCRSAWLPGCLPARQSMERSEPPRPAPLRWPRLAPTCSAKSRANNDEQLASICCSHSAGQRSYLAWGFGAQKTGHRCPVCFSQIFGFLFQNCSVYCLSVCWLWRWPVWMFSNSLVLNILRTFFSFWVF